MTPVSIVVDSDSDADSICADQTIDEHERHIAERRRRNDERLKDSIQSIYRRFGQDLSDIGDEIDLITGRIIVNNGHIARMQDERDLGTYDGLFGDAPDDDASDASPDDDNVDDLYLGKHATDSSDTYSSSDDDADDMFDASAVLDQLSCPEERHQTFLDPALAASKRDHEDDMDLGSAHDKSRGIMQLVPHPSRDASGQHESLTTPDIEAIAALSRRISHNIASYLARQASKQRRAWQIAPLLESIRLPPAKVMLGLDLNMSRHMSPSNSIWSFPDQDSYYQKPAKRRRLLESNEQPQSNDQEVVTQDLTWTNDVQEAAQEAFRSLAYGVGHVAQTNTKSMQPTDDMSDSEQDGTRTVRFRRPRRKFTMEEDRTIKVMREVHGMRWTDILAKLPGRSLRSVHSRYKRELKHLPNAKNTYVKREVVEITSDDEANPWPAIAHDQLVLDPLLQPAPMAPFGRNDPLYAGPSPSPNPAMWGQRTSGIDNVHMYTNPPPQPTLKRKVVPKPRYQQFDSSQGAGQFGILRMDPPPRDVCSGPTPVQASNPSSKKLGSCGVIRPSKPAKRPKITRAKSAAVDTQLGLNVDPSLDSARPHNRSTDVMPDSVDLQPNTKSIVTQPPPVTEIRLERNGRHDSPQLSGGMMPDPGPAEHSATSRASMVQPIEYMESEIDELA